MKRLLVMFLDACRYDYVINGKTPFLNSMINGGNCLPLKTLLGYSDAIDASIFTGVYPQDHGHWIMYKYSPETSPFKMFKALSFIDYIPSNFIIRGCKFALSATVCRILAKRNGYAFLSTHNIPYKVIGNFDWTTNRPLLGAYTFKDYPSLFDILNENNVKHSFINAANLSLSTTYSSSVKVRDKLAKAIQDLDADTKLTFIYLHHLDHFAHRNTINSPKFQAELKHVDKTVELAICEAKQKFGEELQVMVISDHGMADTKNFVDLTQVVKEKGFGKDYLIFLDSTMIHIWYLNPQNKNETRQKIDDLACGHFISDEERQELKIDFKDRYYGDEIYLLDVGYSLFPNFISWLKPYAMHAYHPDESSQLGIVLIENTELDATPKNYVETIDLAPTILASLGVECPGHFKGRNIAKEKRV